MLPAHVIDYANSRIELFTEKRNANYQMYLDYVKKKESSFFYRLFRMKYEQGLWEHWDYYSYDRYIEEMRKIIKTATYYDKMKTPDMFKQFPKDWRDSFYRWCAENDIPY